MFHFREYGGFLLSKEEEQILEEIRHNLSENYVVNFNINFTFNFKKFGIFRHISVVQPFLCFEIQAENQLFQMVAVNLQYNFIGGRGGDSLINENQLWGMKKLKNDFGNVFIRDENIYDKIIELFNKIEIDFKDDAEFSKRYYVVTDNESKTRISLDQNIRRFFTEIPKKENFIFEISNNELIMGNRKPINQYKTYQIANFLKNTF